MKIYSPEVVKNYATQVLNTSESSIDFLKHIVKEEDMEYLLRMQKDLKDIDIFYNSLSHTSIRGAIEELNSLWNRVYTNIAGHYRDYYYSNSRQLETLTTSKSSQDTLMIQNIKQVCINYVTELHKSMLEQTRNKTGKENEVKELSLNRTYYTYKKYLNSINVVNKDIEGTYYSILESTRLYSIRLKTIYERNELYYPHFSILPDENIQVSLKTTIDIVSKEFVERLKSIVKVYNYVYSKESIQLDYTTLENSSNMKELKSNFRLIMEELHSKTQPIFNVNFGLYCNLSNGLNTDLHDKLVNKTHEFIIKDKRDLGVKWLQHYSNTVKDITESSKSDFEKMRIIESIVASILSSIYSKEKLKVFNLTDTIYVSNKDSEVTINTIKDNMNYILKELPSTVGYLTNNSFVKSKSTNVFAQDELLSNMLNNTINLTMFEVEGLTNEDTIYNTLPIKEGSLLRARLMVDLDIIETKETNLSATVKSLDYMIPNIQPTLVETVLLAFGREQNAGYNKE